MVDLELDTITLPLAFLEALSHSDSVESVVPVAARWLSRLVPAARVSIDVLDGKTLVSKCIWASGVNDPWGPPDPSRSTPKIGAEALWGGHHIAVNAVAMAVSASSAQRQLYQAGLRALLIVPLMSADRAVGVLTVAREESKPYSKAEGQLLKVVGKCIAAQITLMQQIRAAARLAETDPLTGLANRARLMRVLGSAGDQLHRPDACGRHVGLLQIDLDHFKAVNDSLGHGVGDSLLRHAAQLMQETAAPKDLVARLGGDEFTVVTRTDPAGQHLARLGQRLAAALSRPIRIGHSEVHIGASIGTAIAQSPGCDAERLIADADLALYQVKRSGRGGVHAFDAAMRDASLRRNRLLNDLRQSHPDRDFIPYFQPLVAMDTGLFRGFEMLARWDHPTFGLLDPKDFLDLVTEVGLSPDIDRAIRIKGLTALRDLRRAGWTAPRMSFNAATRTIADPGLVDTLRREVAAFDLTPADLVIEVREADLTALGFEVGFASISQLASAGFAVSLDDFGAGLACMRTLAHMPISSVKIDHALTSLLPDLRAEKVMRAAITLASELGLSVVAEGVETAEQFARLRQMGCQTAQGFGISRPLPLAKLVGFMASYGKAPQAWTKLDQSA